MKIDFINNWCGACIVVLFAINLDLAPGYSKPVHVAKDFEKTYVEPINVLDSYRDLPWARASTGFLIWKSLKEKP